MFIKTLVVILTTAMLCSCSSKKSRVVFFEYGGHDTTFALLLGEVFEENPVKGSKDSLVPISNVTIKAEDAKKKVYTTAVTNANGQFSLNFYINDTFNIAADKKGYQTLRITNYFADTGQVSKVKIILEKDHTVF